MKHSSRYFICIALCALLFQTAIGQENNISFVEQEAERIEIQLAEQLKDKRSLALQADSMANEVGSLKSKSGKMFGMLNRFRLETKLKDSQFIAKQLQQCEAKIAELRTQYGALALRLDAMYSNKINDLLRRAESSNDSTQITSLQDLYAKRNKWREKMPERTSGALILFEVAIDSMDSPREIREKADLIKDMEEDVRAKLDMLSRRVADLKEEKKIREKMGDFIQEIMVFDDRERGRYDNTKQQLTNESLQRTIDALSGLYTETGLKSGSDQSAVLTRDQIFRFWETIETLDPADVSPQNIDHLVGQYSILMKHLDKRAKELNEKAQQLYRQAGALYK